MVTRKSRSVTSSRRYYFSVADGSSHPVPQVFTSKQLRFLDVHPLTKSIGIDPWPYGPHRITSTLQLQMTGLLLRNHRHDLCTRTTCPRMVSWEREQMCNPVQFMAFFVGPSYPVLFWPNKKLWICSYLFNRNPKTSENCHPHPRHWTFCSCSLTARLSPPESASPQVTTSMFVQRASITVWRLHHWSKKSRSFWSWKVLMPFIFMLCVRFRARFRKKMLC